LVINIEAYIELMIAGIINFKFSLNTTNGEVFGFYVSNYAFITCLFMMPAANIWVLIQNIETIRSPEFIRNWGAFYEEIKTKSMFYVYYYFIFIARRLAFLVICFYLPETPGI
jgi:hypothetical protein